MNDSIDRSIDRSIAATMNAAHFQVSYALPGNETGGRLFVFGEAPNQANQVVLFCAGFPDDCSVFLPLARKLASENPNVLTGVTCLPGYDHHHTNFRREGYTMDEMAATVREAAKVLCSFAPPTAKLTGVFHDWGCIVGAIGANRLEADDTAPHKFGKVVYFDVLPPVHSSLGIKRSYSLYQWVVFPTYTSILALMHLISRYISWILAAIILQIGMVLVPITGLAPLGAIDQDTYYKRRPRPSLYKTVYMCYPYYQMYKTLVLKRLGKLKKSVEYHLPADVDKTSYNV